MTSPSPDQRPFWVVLSLSALVALAVVGGLLIAYWRSPDWQIQLLLWLAIGVLAAHGGAALLARKQHTEAAIWLLMLVKISGVVLTPLFITEFWQLGGLLLAVIPIEVGIADRLRRVPIFLVLSILGASGMVAVDMWTPLDRVTLLDDERLPRTLGVLLMVSQLVLISGLLWRFRLRRASPYYTPFDLVTQQSLTFAVIFALSIVLITGVLIRQIRNNQIEQVGNNFVNIAVIYGERVGNMVDQQVADLSALARLESALIDSLVAANAAYPADADALEAYRQQRQQRWLNSPDTDPFVLEIRNNDATLALSRFRGNALAHQNLFLLDRYGGLVAAQGEKPPQFYYDEQAWWQVAWNYGQGGIYVGDLQIDPSTKVASVFIAVGMINPQTNEMVGVLASRYLLRNLQQDLALASEEIDGRVLLIARDSTIIAAPNPNQIGRPLPPEIHENLPLNTRIVRPDWYMGQDIQRQPAVLSFAPLNNSSQVRLELLREIGWLILVSDTQNNALAEVISSIQVASLVGLIVSAFGILAAVAMAQVITRPIEALTTTATAITEGNLQQRADPAGPTELRTLAEAFNLLTAQLRSFINNLQEQVAQRTEQLEARIEQLATLNRITQTMSSIHNSDQSLRTVTRELVALFHAHDAAITLLTERRSELLIVANYARDKRLPDNVGTRIPLHNYPASGQVIDTSKSVVISNAQHDPRTSAAHDLLRRLNSACIMIVPLLARGEVIGTITVSTDQPQRLFTAAEVSLAETVAGQISGAIESARLYREAQVARAAAESANEAKSAFLASVSHELRTPLTSVLGFAKIIQKRLEERLFPLIDSSDPPVERSINQVSENIRIILAEGERLTALINNVLDLAKIEAGKVEWKMEPLDLREVLERAIQATRALFEQRNLHLTHDFPDNVPLVYGDRDRLIQVVVNLISNAVKFTEEGNIHCALMLRGQAIVVSVQDTGIGIAPEHQADVFTTFKQVGDTLTEKPQGTGLGLSICREIVEHHGGTIWVESRPGEGSTFSFSIPTVSLPNLLLHITPMTAEGLLRQLEQQLLPHKGIETRPLRILLVDDDDATRELYGQELRSELCEIAEAENVVGAIQLIEQQVPDLALLDLMLAQGSGLEVAYYLRKQPRTMGVPILVISSSEDKEVGFRAGVDQYLVKPIDPEIVMAEIQRLSAMRPLQRRVVVGGPDAHMAARIQGYLQQAGHSVLLCDSTPALLKAVTQRHPDMVILDGRMKGAVMEELKHTTLTHQLYLVVYQ